MKRQRLRRAILAAGITLIIGTSGMACTDCKDILADVFAQICAEPMVTSFQALIAQVESAATAVVAAETVCPDTVGGADCAAFIVAHFQELLSKPVGIVVSSDLGGTTELRYYDAHAAFVSDSNNLGGSVLAAVAAGDFDGDGIDEVVAARLAGPNESDLYYFEFGAGTLFADTSNFTNSQFMDVAAGNLDGDAEDEVVVVNIKGVGDGIGADWETELVFYEPLSSSHFFDTANRVGRFRALALGQLDGDLALEVVAVRDARANVNSGADNDVWMHESNGSFINDSSNRNGTFSGVDTGCFDRTGTAANIIVSNDRQFIDLKGHSIAYQGSTAAGTVINQFDSANRNGGQVAIAAGNFDDDIFDEFVALVEDGPNTGFLELFDESATYQSEYKAGPGLAVAVDTADLDGDLSEEVVVLWSGGSLGAGNSQVVIYDIDFSQPVGSRMSVLNSSPVFTGTGTDVAVLLQNPVSIATFQGVHYNEISTSVIEDNLILHLDVSNSNSFDSNTLGEWNDLTTNNNDMSILGGAVTYSSDDGGSLVFDGSDYFSLTTFDNFSSDPLTISMWIKTSLTSRAILMSLSRTPANYADEFIFAMRNSKLYFWDYHSGSSFGFLNEYSSSTVNSDTWKFVTFTKSGTSGKYYINDSLNNSITASMNITYGTDNLIIGKNWRDNNRGYVGNIGAVYVYSSALTSSQIEDNYNSTKSRYGL